MPSSPMRQACSNTVGPSSVRCSTNRMAFRFARPITLARGGPLSTSCQDEVTEGRVADIGHLMPCGRLVDDRERICFGLYLSDALSVFHSNFAAVQDIEQMGRMPVTHMNFGRFKG